MTRLDQEWDLQTALPASLEAIERFFLEFRAREKALLRGPDRFAVELLLREALTNAVLHGCQADPARQVHCILRRRPGRFTIAIRDDGRGFDWSTVRRQSSAPSDCSGRGMEILRHYATRVRFSASGNQTVIVKQLSQGAAQ